MSKNTRNRILLTALAALLLVTLTIGGTVAWLQDKTEAVVNVFTGSDVDIDLDETTGNSYKMVPSVEITKNPKVTVNVGSEACYVFVKIQETGSVTVDDETYTFDDFLTYAIADGWTTDVEGSKTDTANDTYVIGKAVDATTAEGATAVELPILAGNKVTTKSDVAKKMMDALTTENQPKLTFTAYAIQQANGNGTFSMADAWTQLNTPAN